jgi:hypothetical protein
LGQKASSTSSTVFPFLGKAKLSSQIFITHKLPHIRSTRSDIEPFNDRCQVSIKNKTA